MELLILGAGVRAAAWSALRSGLSPTCGDLFADRDLAEACPVRRIEPESYPDGFLPLARDVAPTPWIYTGALENRPGLIAAISGRHRLLGNPPAALRSARDPLALSRAIRDAGLDAPAVAIDPAGLPRDGSWLVKPFASGGGSGIRPWIGPSEIGRSSYYQRRIDGIALAAIYLAEQGRSTWLGVSRQFVGRPGSRYAYRGSLAPWPISPTVQDRVERLGRVVAGSCGLVGLFGIDLVASGERVWPIEVNPRYTASVEILEWTQGRSFLAEHLRACGVTPPAQAWPGGPRLPFAAKAILYADGPWGWPRADRFEMPALGRFPEVADIPHPGTRFRPGQPVVTVFASGDSAAGCRRALAGRLIDWRRRLRPVKPGC